MDVASGVQVTAAEAPMKSESAHEGIKKGKHMLTV